MLRIVKKLSKILNGQQKVRVIILAFLMFVAGLLETISASLMIPLITAAMDENIIYNNKYARMVCEMFDLHSNRTFMVVVIVALMFMYVFKNVFVLFEIYVQNRFISNNKFSLKCEMMQLYLSRPYEDFLGMGTAQIQRAVQTNVDGAFTALTTALSFFMELFTAVVLIVAIIIMNPMMAVATALLLVVLLAIISTILKPVMKKYGIARMENDTKASKWFLQAVNGVKELKVASKEAYFEQQYNYYGKRGISAEKRSNVIGQIPRLSIESFCMVGMLGVMAFLMYKGSDINTLLPQLSAFAVAAIRLLPSANRMSGYMASVSYYEPQLDEMIKNREEILAWQKADAQKKQGMMAGGRDNVKNAVSECEKNSVLDNERQKTGKQEIGKPEIEKQKSGKQRTSKVECGKQESENRENHSADGIRTELSFCDKIELSDITYSYPNTETNVLEHASMEIPIGKSIGVVGGSGAGKTTAIDVLLGLLEPKEGAVLADGRNIQNNYQQWLKNIGYIPQMIYMLDDTIRANVGFGYAKEDIDDAKVWHAIEEAQLRKFVESLPEGLDTVIGERGVRVSGGQRQRIGIARALYEDPAILIFDEATSALDNETEAAIMESINGLHGKKTMVIIAHRLTTIEGCDMVYRVEDKKIRRER